MICINILLVDDESGSRSSVGKFLHRLGHNVTECAEGEEALAKYFTGDYPLVLSDIKMPKLSGIDMVKAISSSPVGWKTDCVLFTGYGDMESAIAALRAGAYDYLLKPVSAREIALLVERVAEHLSLKRENKYLNENLHKEVQSATQEAEKELARLRKVVAQSTSLSHIGFFSSEMKKIVEVAQKHHADRAIPVLIEGETGTGKEIIARIIHYGKFNSDTVASPFVDINCAAFTPNLFESELFGYEPGSFTGGLSKGQKGKLDAAAGGTLFLDELAEIPLDLQGKLLRVIQEKEFYRVGGLKKNKTDVRIVCATNVNLEKKVEQGAFRRDLYYRLSVGHIRIPPLRERCDDIVPTAMIFLRQFSHEKRKQFETFSDEAAAMMQNYRWPGNVRELRNTIEWIVFMHNAKEVFRNHFPSTWCECQEAINVNPVQGNNLMQIVLPVEGYSLNKFKDNIIRSVLEMHKGNKSATARYLGISRKAMNLYAARILKKEKD